MPVIHQFHPTLAPGDAVSDHVFALDRCFRSWGHESAVYALEAKRGADRGVHSYRRLFRGVAPEDVLILHYSIGSELFSQLARLEARRVLVYHNVTPPEFFAGVNPHAAAAADRGVRDLRALASRIELAVALSEFSRRDLAAAGFARTAVVPLLVDWSRYEVAPDDGVLAAWRDVRPLLLYVGRLSPNKRQDDLIRMLAYYRRCVDANAQLVLVGAHRDQPQYHARLRALARDLGLEEAVTFAGSVSLAALVAHYRVASCFVSLSEHEGFGVPLLEAMRFELPIVAYDGGAVGETLDGAGLLLRSRDLAEVAEACALVHERADLRGRLLAAGRRRVADFGTDAVAARTRAALGL